MQMLNMQIDDFADFVFNKNEKNAVIELSLDGLKDSRELFCFFVDLLCKGLVLMHGENGQIELDSITEEQFASVAKKMILMGIRVHLTITPNDTHRKLGVRFEDIVREKFEDYELCILADSKIYSIKFSFVNI
jgi:hypothetical protein